ncbi:MAG: hypothetical protein LDLANPLL_00456 [Turneriella sp.]|nr:hypothetical protein [Turneriella sp.]
MTIELFLKHAKTVLIPEDYFQVALGQPTKEKGAFVKGIELHFVFYQHKQTVDGFAHIRASRANVDAVE